MPPCPLHRALGTLTHLSRTAAPGAAPLPAMVSVSHKPSTARRAAAEAVLRLPPRAWLALTQGGAAHTTPIFSTAVAAGVMGAKQTAALIPLCHSLPLEACDVEINLAPDASGSGGCIHVTCIAAVTGSTGVEMEAMTGASIACLTLYDMLKGASKVPAAEGGGGRGSPTPGLIMERVQLLWKTGGGSGSVGRGGASANERAS